MTAEQTPAEGSGHDADQTVGPDIRACWERYREARRISDEASEIAGDLRRGLVERYGETCVHVRDLWGHDPDYRLLVQANAASNRLASEQIDCLRDLMDHPAKSTADLAVKLAAVLYEWRSSRRIMTEPEGHEEIALTFFNDAEKVLWSMLPA